VEQGQNILLPVVWSAAALKGPPNWGNWWRQTTAL
jgi:hypothetical protein